jgi:GTP pyrophosphokinase
VERAAPDDTRDGADGPRAAGGPPAGASPDAPRLPQAPAPGPAWGADDLVALVATYNPRSSEALLRRAFAFGEAMHAGQTRKSGEPYFTHPVAVARILAEQQMDDATLVTALLHDTIEDTKASFAMIEREFGAEIAELVEGVTNLTKMQIRSTRPSKAENFRKLFMATSATCA